jgi:radical SAM superfamily enzyme YgiQ (UPF0313 family)
LLINPKFPESFWSFRWALDNIVTGKRAINPPLGLATLAALCPPDWQVEIIDENIEAVPLHPDADIVGICGMAVQFRRQCELLEYYRHREHYVVAGGSFASLCPERYTDLADSVISGEAEYIWGDFCRDFERQVPKPHYSECGVVNLEDSPVPRFDLLTLDRYVSVSMQFSRGCPYRCEFCDIIVMFGRKPRNKSARQIGLELDQLRARNITDVFFVDDNFIGNKASAKSLLRYLADYQQRHDYRFRFGTEVTINLADDPELVQLLRAANFTWLFIGIESPDEDSLKETRKTQNIHRNLLGAVHTLYSEGLDVLAGFIIGFDHDTADTFEKQYRFITDSGIQVAMVGLLTALPRTPLYERLENEGRLIETTAPSDNTKPGSNIIPKQMSYETMVQKYQKLNQHLFSDHGIARRIRNKFQYMRSPLGREKYALREGLGNLFRLIRRGLLAGGPRRIMHFLHSISACRPRIWPFVIEDWILGLAMRDYIDRHFMRDQEREWRMVRHIAASISKRCIADIRRGVVEIISHCDEGKSELRILLHGYAKPVFSTASARRLEKLLRETAATLSLRIEVLRTDQQRQLVRMLQRLAPYGDRVSIWLDERIRPLVSIDSSVFHLRINAQAE